MTQSVHADGSICPEGTSSAPPGFMACCEDFAQQTTSCYYDIRYEWRNDLECWLIAIPDSAGGGGIEISFCPHCGASLLTGGKPWQA